MQKAKSINKSQSNSRSRSKKTVKMTDTGKTTKRTLNNSMYTSKKSNYLNFDTQKSGNPNKQSVSSYRQPHGILKSTNSASVLVRNQLQAKKMKTSASLAPMMLNQNTYTDNFVEKASYSSKKPSQAPRRQKRNSRFSKKSRKTHHSPDNMSLYSNNLSVYIDPKNVPKPESKSKQVRKLNLKAFLKI